MQSPSTGKTVATLLELAITAEKVAEDLYLGLTQKFSHLPKVSISGKRWGKTRLLMRGD